MFTRRILLLFCSCVALSIWALSLAPTSWLARFELSGRDFLCRNGRQTEANPKLVFLAIDNASLGIDAKHDVESLFGVKNGSPECDALGLMSQSWPWPRSVHGRILDRLVKAGARVVAFDLTFPTPSRQDDQFREALDRNRANVVIGSNFINTASRREDSAEISYTRPVPSLIPQSSEPDERVGFVNFWPDLDGVVRNADFRTTLSGILGNSAPEEAPLLSLAARAVTAGGFAERIPAGSDSHAFRFTAPPGRGFPPRSVFEIFVPEYWEHNFASGETFRDAIVVIGASGNWQHDEHQTPFGLMSGPELQLNVMNALIHGELLRDAKLWQHWLAWLAAIAVSFGCCVWGKTPAARVSLLVLASVSWVAFQFVGFNQFGVFFPFMGPLLTLGVACMSTLFYDLVRSAAEQLRLRRKLTEEKVVQGVLERAKSELEDKVRERTAELTDSNVKLNKLLNEKELLLKEVHHRVKNNLQVISSLLNLQSEHIKDQESLAIFAETRNRVKSMSLIHEKLYQSADLSRIDFGDYLRSLTRNLQNSFFRGSSSVSIAVNVDQVMLGVDSAVPCGLIVNELVTNCFKYAFPEKRTGSVAVSMSRQDSNLILCVGDDGVGFPAHLDFKMSESLGMQIINTLAEQLGGTIAMSNGVGTQFTVVFPESI